jgi:hypothetical protein
MDEHREQKDDEKEGGKDQQERPQTPAGRAIRHSVVSPGRPEAERRSHHEIQSVEELDAHDAGPAGASQIAFSGAAATASARSW